MNQWTKISKLRECVWFVCVCGVSVSHETCNQLYKKETLLLSYVFCSAAWVNSGHPAKKRLFNQNTASCSDLPSGFSEHAGRSVCEQAVEFL